MTWSNSQFSWLPFNSSNIIISYILETGTWQLEFQITYPLCYIELRVPLHLLCKSNLAGSYNWEHSMTHLRVTWKVGTDLGTPLGKYYEVCPQFCSCMSVWSILTTAYNCRVLFRLLGHAGMWSDAVLLESLWIVHMLHEREAVYLIFYN